MMTAETKATVIKKWENVALHSTFAEQMTYMAEIKGLWVNRPKCWYSYGRPFYIKLTKAETIPIPGMVVNIEQREKSGRQYFLLRPIPINTPWNKVLFNFSSGDLWRSYYKFEPLEGSIDILEETYGSSRGGAHSAVEYIVVAEVGSVFKISQGGFKSRYPSEDVYQVTKGKRYIVINLKRKMFYVYEREFTIEEGDKDWKQLELTIPFLKRLGNYEDYLVSRDLGEQ